MTDENTKPDIHITEHAPQEGQDDLNSTMMAIDVGKLDLSDIDTKTEVKIEMPTDDEIIQEKLEKKKTPLARFFSKLITPRFDKSSSQKELPSFLTRFVDVWVCQPSTTAAHKVLFYLLRIIIVGLAVYLHFFLFELFQAADAHKGTRIAYTVLLSMDAIIILLTLLFRLSPGWLVAAPTAILSLFFGYLAIFFDTADIQIFSVYGSPLISILHEFYIGVLGYLFFMGVFVVARNLLSRVFLGLLSLLSIAPMVFCHLQGVNLEMSLFGSGVLSKIPTYYLQPTYLSLQVFIPLMAFILLFMGFTYGHAPSVKIRRGFARSLTFLLFALMVTNFSVMQNNRVFHVMNFVFPQSLDVGGVDMEILNHNIRIETKNFHAQAGIDKSSRYQFTLKKGQKDNQYLLQVVDKFEYPVRNLKKEDLVVFNDGVKIKKFSFKEEPDVNDKRGNYIITFNLEAKNQIITWDRKTKTYSNQENIVFELSQLSQIKRFYVGYQDEALLDIVNPKTEKIQLPLNYFNTGDYVLKVSLYDRNNEEIFNDKIQMTISQGASFSLLSPLKGDSVRSSLPVLITPQFADQKGVTSVTYLIDGDVLYKTQEVLFYHSLDISDLAEGDHTLTVVAQTAGGKLEEKVNFMKQEESPELVILEPHMGAFSKSDAAVTFDIKQAKGRAVAGVSLFVNGNSFSDFTIEDKSFILPISRWFQSEIYLTVQATLDNGVKVSDWVQVNKGLSVLDLEFDAQKLSFLNYENVVVLIDASISNLDNWQGKEKWRFIKKIVTDNEIDKRLGDLNPSVIVFGAEDAHYYSNCNDTKEIIKKDRYSKALLRRQLSLYQPNGVSALTHALKEAYKRKPEKIFVFADNRDSCSSSFNAIDKLIKQSEKTQIDIFALGQITEESEKWLKKLSEKTGGNFYQPDSYNHLKKNWLGEMSLSYELYMNDRLIERDALGSRKFYLSPGLYKLQIPYGLKRKEMAFTLENNTTTKLKISGEKGDIQVKEIRSRM
ncbi:MAG: Ig-like domain-containing protein [bacterium]